MFAFFVLETRHYAHIYTGKEPNKYARCSQVNASISLIETRILYVYIHDDDEDAVYMHPRTPASRIYTSFFF